MGPLPGVTYHDDHEVSLPRSEGVLPPHVLGGQCAGRPAPFGARRPADGARRGRGQPGRRLARRHPRRSRDAAAVAALSGADGQRQGAHDVLRREPRLRPAVEDLAGDAGRSDRHRGPPLLRARGHRLPRLRPSLAQDPHRGHAGSVDADAAVREARPRRGGRRHQRQGGRPQGHRDDDRAQDRRGALRDGAGGPAHQGGDPRAVPEHRLLRRRRVRRRGRRPALLRHDRREAHAAAGGHVGRHRAEPRLAQPRQAPRARHRPPRRRAESDGQVGHDHRGRGGRGQAGGLRPREGAAHEERLHRLEVPVPLRLRAPHAAPAAQHGRHRRGAGEHAQAGRPDHPDDDRPRGSGRG